MTLLILFAFVAGAGTALSPCVLPVLPAVLASGVTGGRGRPVGVATGLVLSFTFATVALIYLLDALGLPDDFARNLAIAALVVFGLTLLVPAVSDRLEAALSRITAGARAGSRGGGFGSGLLLGFSLGFVYAPCAGPILAGVVTASASQPFTAEKLFVALAYGIGSGIVIYGLMLGGRKLAVRLRPIQARVNLAMGLLMIAFAVVLVAELDLKFQRVIAEDAPAFIRNPVGGLEESRAVADDLSSLRGGDNNRQEGGLEEAATGKKLPVLGQAPDFADTQEWFNSEPLSIPDLEGKVVLLDFWTYTCINCIRTFPNLRAWWNRYEDDGLVIVGVHTPEFPFEREASNVESAISEYDLTYPVVQDNEFGTWNAYGNQYWPAKYLIDAEGNVRYVHFGEGAYEETEKAIRSLLAERGSGDLGAMASVRTEAPALQVTTPETYLGGLRAETVVNGPLQPGVTDYEFPEATAPPSDSIAYLGRWDVTADDATAAGSAIGTEENSRLKLEFGAGKVFLVLGSEGGRRPVEVLLDGKPIRAEDAGADVRDGAVTVDEQRLYELVDLPRVERHLLELRFAPGVSGYAFTFG